MTKPKLEPVRAWVWTNIHGTPMLGTISVDKDHSENLGTRAKWAKDMCLNLVEVLITPVIPTHPPELSVNTGELKHTKETPRDATSINDDPILFSLLYDLDLLPEQVKEGTPDYVRMQIVIEHWKMKSSKTEEFVKRAIEREIGEDYLKIKDLQSQLEDYRKALMRLHKYILNHSRVQSDHACRQCCPHSEILIDGFVCCYHEAKSAMAKEGEAK